MDKYINFIMVKSETEKEDRKVERKNECWKNNIGVRLSTRKIAQQVQMMTQMMMMQMQMMVQFNQQHGGAIANGNLLNQPFIPPMIHTLMQQATASSLHISSHHSSGQCSTLCGPMQVGPMESLLQSTMASDTGIIVINWGEARFQPIGSRKI
jgi:hypothetical protein